MALVVLGASLRYWGLWWGLPERVDFHPDENYYVIQHAMEVSLAHPDPIFINYPSFLCYTVAILRGALQVVVGWGQEIWQVYLIGRAVSALYGTLTVLAAFLLARRLGAKPIGALLAAFWVAILPLHVWESHVAVTDIMMTFWVLLTLWAALGMLQAGRFKWGPCLAAGLFLGLATGSKYTAALVAIGPLVAVLLGKWPWRDALKGLVVVALISLAACFVVTPYSFIRFPDLLKSMAYENEHTHGHHLGFSNPADGPQYHNYLYQLVAAWPFSCGLVLYGCVLAGMAWAVFRHSRSDNVVLAFWVVFFGITGSWSFTPLRYYMPLLVIGVIYAGVWQGEWFSCEGSVWRRRLALGAVALAAGYTGVFTLSTTSRFSSDTRAQADRWMRQNLGATQKMHMFGWRHYTGFLDDDKDNRMLQHTEGVLSKADGIPPSELIEITSLHYLRWYRHNERRYMSAYDTVRDPRGHFECVAIFDAPYLNRDLYGSLDPMYRCYFISPTIEIYRHKPLVSAQ